jgi:DNA-binding response OmpR family regulator
MTTPRRVLVVDDDPIVRRIVGSVLGHAGFALVYANDGEAGWRELQGKPFDLVITDRSMPHLDGLQLTRRIRASAEHATLPVIMLTGSTQDEVGREAADEGANAFLTKLLSSRELLATVERVLHDAQLPPSST